MYICICDLTSLTIRYMLYVLYQMMCSSWNVIHTQLFAVSCLLSIFLVVVFVIFKQVFLLCKFCEYIKI